LDRLTEDPLAADPRLEHAGRDLAPAEARHLDRTREIRSGVLHRVPEIRLRDLDPQPDSVVRKLLDLRRHRPAHSSKVTPAAGERALLIVVGLAVAVVEVLEPRHQPDPAEIDLVRARVVRDVVWLAGAVGEVGDPL